MLIQHCTCSEYTYLQSLSKETVPHPLHVDWFMHSFIQQEVNPWNMSSAGWFNVFYSECITFHKYFEKNETYRFFSPPGHLIRFLWSISFSGHEIDMSIWAVSRENMLQDLCRCHTKRRIGRAHRPILLWVWHRLSNYTLLPSQIIFCSRCHTKRRIGKALPANPSLGMTTTKTLRSVFLWHVSCILLSYVYSHWCPSKQTRSAFLFWCNNLTIALKNVPDLNMVCVKPSDFWQ